jgi:hypothetical protein
MSAFELVSALETYFGLRIENESQEEWPDDFEAKWTESWLQVLRNNK